MRGSELARKRKRKKRKSKWQRQYAKAASKAKYGTSMKPAPVKVIQADGSEKVVDQSAFVKEQRRSRYRTSDRLEDLAKRSGFESYAHFLRSKGWKDLRREALIRDNWRCVGCECKIKLQVHHRRYPKRLGEEELQDVETLCSVCHDETHKRRKKKKAK